MFSKRMKAIYVRKSAFKAESMKSNQLSFSIHNTNKSNMDQQQSMMQSKIQQIFPHWKVNNRIIQQTSQQSRSFCQHWFPLIITHNFNSTRLFSSTISQFLYGCIQIHFAPQRFTATIFLSDALFSVYKIAHTYIDVCWDACAQFGSCFI